MLRICEKQNQHILLTVLLSSPFLMVSCLADPSRLAVRKSALSKINPVLINASCKNHTVQGDYGLVEISSWSGGVSGCPLSASYCNDSKNNTFKLWMAAIQWEKCGFRHLNEWPSFLKCRTPTPHSSLGITERCLALLKCITIFMQVFLSYKCMHCCLNVCSVFTSAELGRVLE